MQEISTKGNNINKIIEIPNKSSIISCDQKYITKYKKASNEEYRQANMVKIISEIKCIEYINDDVFAAVMPENNAVVFYDVDSIHNNYIIIEKINTVHGRYVIKNVEKFKSIFFASSLGIYVFSNVDYKLISIYNLDYWISAICFDFEKDCLVCAGMRKVKENEVNIKKLDLIIIPTKQNELEKEENNKIKIEKIYNISNEESEEITVINCLRNKILIGSKNKKIQLYNY